MKLILNSLHHCIIRSIGLVLIIVGLIFSVVSNAVPSYGINNYWVALLTAVLSLVFMAGGILSTVKFGKAHFLVLIADVLTIVCLSVFILILIQARAVLAASQFTYDNSNQQGWAALIPSIVSLACQFGAIIIIIIASFLKDRKPDSEAGSVQKSN